MTIVEASTAEPDLCADDSPRRRDAPKRLLDIVLSSVLLILLIPVFFLVALAIAIDDGRPIFYTCRRVGHRGRPLGLLKFRKMHKSAAGPALTVSGDDRLTSVGRFLVASKLDELPQLWNVLKGDMSLVGPRPEDPRYVALNAEQFEQILAVRPGITGLSQLAFRREAEILDPEDAELHYTEQLLPQKIGMDMMYASKRTIGMDLRLLVWTVASVLFGVEVAVDRRSARLGRRRRPAEQLEASASERLAVAAAERS